MAWTKPFAIYRVNEHGTLEPVYLCEDVKKAKYWLSYIAQPGDVLCRTPAHPKHSKTTNIPEYWCHREQERSSLSEESRWRLFVKPDGDEIAFPDSEPPMTA
jgi:hypothetical protein